MRRTTEDAEKTRLSLIDAALAVFLGKGYADTTIEDICMAAKTTRGAFYHYFDSKKAVYYALLEERLKKAQMMMFDILESDFSPLAKIRKLAVSSLSLFRTDRGYREANELTLLKTGYVEELSEGMKMKTDAMRSTCRGIERLLADAVAAGEIRLATDPRRSAMHLFSAITGAGSLWLLDPKFFNFPVEAETYVDMWIEGIRVK